MIIGFCGLPRTGKTTSSLYLAGEHFALESFAGPLKEAAAIIYPQVGDDFISEKKDEVNDELGITPRYILQKLGTEVGRGIHEDTWVLNMIDRINRNTGLGLHTVVDDVRFPNEVEVCDYLVHISRPGCEPKYIIDDEGQIMVHPSDSYNEELSNKASYHFNNSEDVDYLERYMNWIIEDINRP